MVSAARNHLNLLLCVNEAVRILRFFLKRRARPRYSKKRPPKITRVKTCVERPTIIMSFAAAMFSIWAAARPPPIPEIILSCSEMEEKRTLTLQDNAKDVADYE